MVTATVVVGVGSASTLPHLSDVGAWLGNRDKGSAVHVNGLTGQVDGRVQVPGMAGHPLQISQDGKSVLVVDERTHRVSRIDISQLTVGKSQAFAAARIQVAAGGVATYVVDPVRGTVQQIDATSLAPRGGVHSLTPPLGKAVVDPEGTLWVPVLAKGQVVPFRGGVPGVPVKAGNPNDPLLLSLAGGRPVVVDPAVPALISLSPTGPVREVRLPDAVAAADPGSVLVPDSAEGAVVPVLATGTGTLVLANIDAGSVRAVRLPSAGHRLAAPQVLADKVYVPDQSDGTLIVYDSRQAEFESKMKVTGRSGPLEAFVHNGLLWVNDETHAAAAVVDANGGSHRIGKYDTSAPSGSKPKRKRAGDGSGQDEQPHANNPPDQHRDATTPPEPTRSPKPTPKPPAPPVPSPEPTEPPPVQPPGTPTAQSEAGRIRIDFAAAAGARPTGYRLQDVPSGATAQPTQVPASGPFSFEVVGGDCAQEYSFRVVALYAGGQTAVSAPSTPVRPCIAPGEPRNFTAKRHENGGHGVDLSWQAPANAAGSNVTYQLSWSGGANGSRTVNGTSTTVDGLRNSQQYDFRISASNAAGSGSAEATAHADLTPPGVGLSIYNNEDHDGGVAVKPGPSTAGGRIAVVPQGQNPPVTVFCQVRGEPVRDENRARTTSSVWDRLTYDGKTGWVSDIYVGTSMNRQQRNEFSPEVWQCD